VKDSGIRSDATRGLDAPEDLPKEALRQVAFGQLAFTLPF